MALHGPAYDLTNRLPWSALIPAARITLAHFSVYSTVRVAQPSKSAAPDSDRIPSSLDHLVGDGEQLAWNIDAERLRGPAVDHQLVLGRRLHRKVGGLLALQDAINVAGRAPERIGCIGSIGDQATADSVVADRIDRGQSVAGRARDDQFAMDRRERARRHDQAAIR